METHGIVADWRDDELTIYASTQFTISVRLSARGLRSRRHANASAGLDLDVCNTLVAASVAHRDLQHMRARASDHRVGDFNALWRDESPDALRDVDVVATEDRDLRRRGIDLLAAAAGEFDMQGEGPVGRDRVERRNLSNGGAAGDRTAKDQRSPSNENKISHRS